MNFVLMEFPWTHGYSNKFLEQERAIQIQSDFPEWESDVWDTHGKVFKSEYGYKKELTDKSVMSKSIVDFISDLESDLFISRISSATGITDLFIDHGMYGGGLNIYPPGSHLTTHIDFNYNNDLNAYRSVNLLYYLNDNWNPSSGGCFELFDVDLNKCKTVKPELNTCIFFATNNGTYHGVSETQNGFYRKSISIWYYTKRPTENLSEKPHKTLWVK